MRPIMHQYLFFIGNFPIRLYGIFFSLGIISGCITAYFLLKKDRRGWESHMFDLGLVIAFAGIVGGRLWDVFFFDRVPLRGVWHQLQYHVFHP